MKLLPIVKRADGKTGGNGATWVVVAHAKVDDKFYIYLKQYRWYFTGGGYPARARGDGIPRAVCLHTEIAKLMGWRITHGVDHIYGDKLDARFENLRPATSKQNNRNRHVSQSTTGFKGVWQTKGRGRYRAQISTGGHRNRSLGSYDTATEAAEAYDAAAIALYGHFARTNKSLGLL